MVIAQHINAVFLPTLTADLDAHSRVMVRSGNEGDILKSGEILFVHDKVGTIEKDRSGNLRLGVCRQECEHTPSVNALFRSAAMCIDDPKRWMAALLTGIGDDGAVGLGALRTAGVATIAESEESAVVFGMPRTAIEIGAAQEVLPLDRIIDRIIAFGGF